MNKDLIANDLDELVKSIDERFKVINDVDLILMFEQEHICFISKFNPEKLIICGCTDTYAPMIVKTDVIRKFYFRAIALLGMRSEKAVQMING